MTQEPVPDGLVMKFHKRFDVSDMHVGDYMPDLCDGYSYYISAITETHLHTHVHFERII